MKKSKFQSNFNILHVWLVKKWLVNWKLNYTKNILCVFKLWNYKSKQVIFWNPNNETKKHIWLTGHTGLGCLLVSALFSGSLNLSQIKKPLLRFFRWTTDFSFFIGAQYHAPNFSPFFSSFWGMICL